MCLGQQQMNYPFSSLPSFPFPFHSLPSLSLPYLSPRVWQQSPPVYRGPGYHPRNFLLKFNTLFGAFWCSLATNWWLCTMSAVFTSSLLGQHFVWVAAPISAIAAPAVWVSPSMHVWHGGVMVRASDLQPRGRRFKFQLHRSTCCTLGKLFTHLCLCSLTPSSINWYRRKLGAKQAIHATH